MANTEKKIEQEIKQNIKNQELTKKLTKRMQEIDEIYDIEELVEDNKAEFAYKEKEYRLRKPSRKELRDMKAKKNEKFNQLLQEKDDNGNLKYILKEQLIDIYEKRGISFTKMNQKFTELSHKEEQKLLKLVKAENKKEIKELKKDIENIRIEQDEISNRKADLLEFSLEDTLKDFINTYLCYLLFEQKVDGKWKRVFDNYEDFMNCEDADLITRALYFLIVLIRYEIF